MRFWRDSFSAGERRMTRIWLRAAPPLGWLSALLFCVLIFGWMVDLNLIVLICVLGRSLESEKRNTLLTYFHKNMRRKSNDKIWIYLSKIRPGYSASIVSYRHLLKKALHGGKTREVPSHTCPPSTASTVLLSP